MSVSLPLFGYNGEEHIPDAGLQYLRARFYDTGTGRFVSQDTYGGYLETPVTQNQYLYAEGNPVGNMDPSGHVTKNSNSNKKKISQTGQVPKPDPAPLQKSSTKKDEKKKAPAPIVEPPAVQKKNNGSKTRTERVVETGGGSSGGGSGGSGGTSNPFEDYAPTTNEAKRIISQEIADRANASGEGQMTLLDDGLQLTIQNTSILNRQFCSGNLKKFSAGNGTSNDPKINEAAQIIANDAATQLMSQDFVTLAQMLNAIYNAIVNCWGILVAMGVAIVALLPVLIPIAMIFVGAILVGIGIYLAVQDAQAKESEEVGAAEGDVAVDVPAPRANNRTIAGRSGDLPLTSDPDSSLDLRDEETGELIQRRFYGPDGKAQFDIDFKHGGLPGNHEFPHRHDWDWSTDPPTRIP